MYMRLTHSMIVDGDIQGDILRSSLQEVSEPTSIEPFQMQRQIVSDNHSARIVPHTKIRQDSRHVTTYVPD